jgi:hypothetical protein
VDVAVNPQKGLLAQIDSGIIIGNHHVEIVGDRVFVPGYKLPESGIVSGDEFPYQTIVACRRVGNIQIYAL